MEQDAQNDADNLEKLLIDFIKDIEETAKKTNVLPCIYNKQLRTIVFTWYEKAWLLTKPTNKAIKYTMNKMGYKSNSKGQWMKQF